MNNDIIFNILKIIYLLWSDLGEIY